MITKKQTKLINEVYKEISYLAYKERYSEADNISKNYLFHH